MHLSPPVLETGLRFHDHQYVIGIRVIVALAFVVGSTDDDDDDNNYVYCFLLLLLTFLVFGNGICIIASMLFRIVISIFFLYDYKCSIILY